MDKDTSHTTDHEYTVSSSCEPKGLGELTKRPSQCIHCVPHYHVDFLQNKIVCWKF